MTATEYVSHALWQSASLDRCPRHPNGGCGLSKHGTYPRVHPPGARVARWRCPVDGVTFSLLPDCLAARFSSTLAEVEDAVVQVEERPGTLDALAAEQRPGLEDVDRVQGRVRWLRRRVRAVHAALAEIARQRPDLVGDRRVSIRDFREALGGVRVLLTLRRAVEAQLQQLPPPLGFGPSLRRMRSTFALPHEGGRSPPGCRR